MYKFSRIYDIKSYL